MKKLLLFCLSMFILFACKGQNEQHQMQVEDIGLEELTCEGSSILSKLDENLFYDFDYVEKFSVDLMVRPKNENAVSITVSTLGHSVAKGRVPYFTAYLVDGDNKIKIISTSKKDPKNKKEYTIRISKLVSSVTQDESSSLKALKLDGEEILGRMENSTIYEYPNVEDSKNEAMLFVLPHNSNAKVGVLNGGETVGKTNVPNTYKVVLSPGLNEIYIAVNSNKEGEKLYIIKIYRKVDLTLKSFKINNDEYCNGKGEITHRYLRFPAENSNIKLSVVAKLDTAKITFKHNGDEIKPNDGFYNLKLTSGDNGIEVIVEDSKGVKRKTYNLVFECLSENSANRGILRLEVDKTNLLPLMSKENSVVLPSCDNNVQNLSLEVLATSEYMVKVLVNGVENQSTTALYNVTLQEGKNNIIVNLIKGGETKTSYSIFITRYPEESVSQAPQSDEVKVKFVVSDGVNGSSVDGSYLNISNSKNPTSSTNKRILIRNGKAEANLKKNEYYDFKVEGQNDEYSFVRYAASDVISYYVGSSDIIVPIVQRPLQRITKIAKAPEILALNFGADVLAKGEEKVSSVMQDVSIKVKSQAPCGELDGVTPYPMLGVGFVPTTADMSEDVIYATVIQDNSKKADGTYESSWKWSSSSISLVKEEYIDVVVVVYDFASNRTERHIRLKNGNVSTEDSTISVSDMKLSFLRYPTASNLYSVGRDEEIGTGSHYTAELSFDVKIGTSSIPCKCFDLYRKCVEENTDFVLVKRVVNKTAVAATPNKPHLIYDSDGLLEDEKTYQYKVVAYTPEGKKSALSNSTQVEIVVPKSTTLLLEHPVNRSITLNEAKNLEFIFRFSNPKALKNAKEMKLGLLITDRIGACLYGSKFKYVFDEGGKPELYFAKSEDKIRKNGRYVGTNYSQKLKSLSGKSIQDVILVDVENGIVKIKKDFISIKDTNIAVNNKIIYKKGLVYYWDVCDWGSADDVGSFRAAKIVMKQSDNVTVIIPVNDYKNGDNAWNGHAQFGVKFD
ncbi:MAG: dentilisin complex subunit PrcA [Treponema sp.]